MIRPDIQLHELWPQIPVSEDLVRALEWAREHLMPVMRFNGEPVFFHTLRVANIVVEEFATLDPEAITIALLHDIVEDGNITRTELKDHFGKSVSIGVSILSKDSYTEKPRRNLRLAVSRAWDAVKIVKLADCLDNCRAKISTSKARSALNNAWEMLALLERLPQSPEVKCAMNIVTIHLDDLSSIRGRS